MNFWIESPLILSNGIKLIEDAIKSSKKKFIVVDTFQNLAKGKPSDYHHLIVKRRLRIIESFDRFYDKNSDLLDICY